MYLSNKAVKLADKGNLFVLTASVIDGDRTFTHEELGDSLVWSSSNTNVATCEDGVITAVGYGVCVIRATYMNKASSICTVSIPNPNPLLSISEDEIELSNIGKQTRITAISDLGEDISNTVTWITSNSNIATCSNGTVTAVGYGSCTITASYPEHRKTATCIVTVKDPTAPSISLSSKALSLKTGDEQALTPTLANNAGSTVTWTTSDPDVAVCNDGVVTAVGKGVCVILAMTEKGYTSYCIVTVDGYAPKRNHLEYLTFNFPSMNRELRYVNKDSGQIISRAVVISYNMQTQLLNDGRLVVEITLNCVKTYDCEGAAGDSAAIITTDLYRENNVFCDNKQYTAYGVAVGDAFEVKCSGFTVQTNEHKPRELYMTFASISE